MRLPNGIRQRGVRFFVDVTIQGVRRTATCATPEEALATQAKLKAELLGEPARASQATAHSRSGLRTVRSPHQGCTLQEAFDTTRTTAWTDCHSREHLARNAGFALKFFGPSTPLKTITTDKVDEYVAHLLQQGNCSGTVNRKLAALSKMLTVAIQRGKLDRKPHIGRKRESLGRVRFVTPAEEARALQTLTLWGKADHRDVVCVLVDTGLRPSELWRLEGRDCHFDTGLINVWQTKTNKPRSVP